MTSNTNAASSAANCRRNTTTATPRPSLFRATTWHADNYALRVRLVSRKVHVDMTPDVNPVAVLDEYRDRFSEAYVTVKGPSVGGTRYEVEREIDTRIAAELIKRGGSVIIKNRYSVWIEEDGWSVDVFGRAGMRRSS